MVKYAKISRDLAGSFGWWVETADYTLHWQTATWCFTRWGAERTARRLLTDPQWILVETGGKVDGETDGNNYGRVNDRSQVETFCQTTSTQ